MRAEDSFLISFFTAVMAAAAFRIARRIKANKKFKQSIQSTIGEASACKDSPTANAIIRVHILQGASTDQVIGLEFLTERLHVYRISSMTLSRAEAAKLVTLLGSATRSEQEVPTGR